MARAAVRATATARSRVAEQVTVVARTVAGQAAATGRTAAQAARAAAEERAAGAQAALAVAGETAAAAQAASGLTGTGIGGLGTGASIYGTGGGLAQGGAGMLNTLANIYGTGAATAGQGLGFESAAPGTFASTSQLPYATYQGINQGQWQQLQNLLGTLGGMQNLSQTGMQDYLNLYGQGNQQQANLANIYGTQVKAAQNTFGDLAQVGSGLGSLASKIPWSSIGTMIA